MRLLAVGVAIALSSALVWAQAQRTSESTQVAVTAPPNGSTAAPAISAMSGAVNKGAKWLASVQGADGGWGQDGGETSQNRPGERLESSGNDVANTAVAALALLEAGKEYQPNVQRALAFILQHVESSPVDGLAITTRQGTQIQRKLGPYIDTFLTSMLLVRIDGRAPSPALNTRVRQALQKTVAKIEKHQQADGSWNIAGGWAPVLGTSMASRSLYEAKAKGVAVNEVALKRADDYSVRAFTAPQVPAAGVAEVVSVSGLGVGSGTGAGMASAARVGSASGAGTGSGEGVGAPVFRASAPAESAGVQLYQSAQALEQLSRSPTSASYNAETVGALQRNVVSAGVVAGFGSMGGEEFFSYLNISDSMKRLGGEQWTKWYGDITKKIVALQNEDGTWAGHHCITGRVAMTSAAILNLTVDRAR